MAVEFRRASRRRPALEDFERSRPLAKDAVIDVDAPERQLAQEERDLNVISRVARLKLAAFKRLKRVLGGYG